MNILAEVRKDHSRVMRDRIVAYVGSDPARFAELVMVYLAGPYRVTQRSAWPLSYCVQRYPSLILPHLKVILKLVMKPDAPVAVKRNTIRLLQFIDIPKSFQGTVANLCFAFLANPKEAIAVRVFSITVLHHIAVHQPALQKELRIILEDQLPYAGPGFTSRATSVLKELSK